MERVKYWEESRMEGPREQVPDVTADIELSMNKFFLNNLEENENIIKTEKITVPPLNPLILYSIALHQQANNISEMIKQNESAKSTEKVDFHTPEFANSENLTIKHNLNFSKNDFVDQDVEVNELSKTIVRKVLTKAIATLFAHIGYETCQQSALDVLTDVLHEFYRKITSHVKIALEDQEKNRSGFPHVMERVLTEMGMGGIKGLNDYYQSRVIKYVSVLENRCQQLCDDYNASLLPRPPSPVDKINKVVRVKVEEEDVVEVENPEVHFSTMDGDVNFSILEPGYQLLKSLDNLEAETNSQGMTDSVENITVSESPSFSLQ
ncbi:STAGA complex 65 subunit gamma isoform X2 [Tribolium castaneum]|uniref:STAGA complex 65 subunit gamma isoform X2 n=1 Tax=Tribolium castaneum TaxID=7070 RepID=UPI00077DA369|nr:PREDICTED: STAGA complex 65 subunit gamma isoform X2 [Tribolium castaneum]|eukprot:XP_015839593.1 PREDICTED: STAGA complex 65 subunit gamma isoform X2 [Tribolium castaneum]